MTTHLDYSDTTERAHYRKLLNDLNALLSKGYYYKIKEEHLDCLKFYRNEQIQEVLKYSYQGKA